MAFLPGLMSRLPMIGSILKPLFKSSEQVLINAGTQAVTEIAESFTEIAGSVMNSAVGQLQPSEVHATEDAAVKAIETSLKTLKVTGLSLHSKQKLTQAEIKVMFLLINKNVSKEACEELILKVSQRSTDAG